MIFTAPLIGATVLFSGFVSALPRPDSAVGEEVGVSAPNGIPLTNSVELSSQLASEASTAVAAQVTDSVSNSGSNYGSNSGYGVGGYSVVVTTTSSALSSYSTPSYGSGSSNWGSSSWGGSGYDNCVSQCIATYGSPASPYSPPSSTVEDSSGSSGNGVTHTVIVAPTQGVLRYIPFAVNASIGDTVKFMWGANNHTVTKSSALAPCNKSDDALFASGTQNKDFVFTQVVNDTNPTYFYCGTPTHCQKGMFGIINPPSAFGTPTSFSGMIQSMGAQNPDVAAYTSYTSQQTANDAAASKWGGNIDLSALPDWAQPMAAENVLYTRNFLAQNSEVLKDDGSIDLSTAGTTPLMIPQDVGAALNNAGYPSSSSSAAASSAAPASTASSTPASAAANNNGAGSLTSPRALVGFVVVLATLFAL